MKTEQNNQVIEMTEELTANDIKVYIPTKQNINYHGERVFVIGAMVYWISVRKSDNKAMITYNLAPDQIMEEHFKLATKDDVPKRIYQLFQKKLDADIGRLDNMMTNLIKNKGILNIMFNFVEDMKVNWADWLEDAEEYTSEDALKDKQIDALKQQNTKTKTRKSPKDQKRALQKARRKQSVATRSKKKKK